MAPLLIIVAVASTNVANPPLPMLKFVCTGTQTSSRSDATGKLSLPWQRTYRISQIPAKPCSGICRGARIELTAQKIIMHSPDDGRISTPLTLDRTQLSILGHQVTSFGHEQTLTLDTVGKCLPGA